MSDEIEQTQTEVVVEILPEWFIAEDRPGYEGFIVPSDRNVEAAQYLRMDEIGHTPKSAVRTLTYWRDKSQLKATKFARRVWYRKMELDRFLEIKTQA